MAASWSRLNWQAFKKEYPEFTQDRRVKADLGPQLDKLTKTYATIGKAEDALNQLIKDAVVQFDQVLVSLKAYKVVADATKSEKLQTAFREEYAGYKDARVELDRLVDAWRDYRRVSKDTRAQ